jgi:Caspase domain
MKLYNMLKFFILLFLGICQDLTVHSQCAEYDIINLRKTAIVFGQKNYKYGALTNPANDAQDISDSLKKIGFMVYTYYDSDLKTMESALENWYSNLKKFDVALFYYSGHGAEVGGVNYLFPIDANPKSPSDLPYMAYTADKVLAFMEENNSKFNLMILDACRNNPFIKSWSRDWNNGLKAMSGKGSFIGFAASPGTTASDGRNRNGTYTEGILKYLLIPNLTIDQIFTKVNAHVRTASKNEQIPFRNSSLSSDFCFTVRFDGGSPLKSVSNTSQPSSNIFLNSTEEILYTFDTSKRSLNTYDSKNLTLLMEAKIGYRPSKIVGKKSGNLYFLDTLNNKLVILKKEKNSSPIDYPILNSVRDFIISNNESEVYYFNKNKILALNLKSGKEQTLFQTHGQIQSFSISMEERKFFTTELDSLREGSLNIYDAKNSQRLKTLACKVSGRWLAVAPNNKRIYVPITNEYAQQQIAVYDIATLSRLASFPFNAKFVAFTPENDYLLAVDTKQIGVFNLEKFGLINTLPFSSTPEGITVSDDLRAYVWLPQESRPFVYPILPIVSQTESLDPEVAYQEFKTHLKNTAVIEPTAQLKDFFTRSFSAAHSVAANLQKEFGEAFELVNTENSSNIETGTVIRKFGIRLKSERSKYIWPVYTSILSEHGAKFILKDDYSEAEVLNLPAKDIEWGKVSNFVRTYFFNRLKYLK